MTDPKIYHEFCRLIHAWYAANFMACIGFPYHLCNGFIFLIVMSSRRSWAFLAQFPFLRCGPLNVLALLQTSEKRHRHFHLGQMRSRSGTHVRAERKMPCRCPVNDELVRPFGSRRFAVVGSQLGVAGARNTVYMRILFGRGGQCWDIDLAGKQGDASVQFRPPVLPIILRRLPARSDSVRLLVAKEFAGNSFARSPLRIDSDMLRPFACPRRLWFLPAYQDSGLRLACSGARLWSARNGP